MHASMMAAAASSTRRRSSRFRPSNDRLGCRLPSPAWNTLLTRMSYFTAIAAIAVKYDIRVSNVFHAGDGNLHPNLSFDGRNLDERRRVEEAAAAIMEACIAAGGTITGEHGVGSDKLRYMPLVFDAETLTAMRDTRLAWDPAERANPGKVVPVH